MSWPVSRTSASRARHQAICVDAISSGRRHEPAEVVFMMRAIVVPRRHVLCCGTPRPGRLLRDARRPRRPRWAIGAQAHACARISIGAALTRERGGTSRRRARSRSSSPPQLRPDMRRGRRWRSSRRHRLRHARRAGRGTGAASTARVGRCLLRILGIPCLSGTRWSKVDLATSNMRKGATENLVGTPPCSQCSCPIGGQNEAGFRTCHGAWLTGRLRFGRGRVGAPWTRRAVDEQLPT